MPRAALLASKREPETKHAPCRATERSFTEAAHLTGTQRSVRGVTRARSMRSNSMTLVSTGASHERCGKRI